MILKIVVDTNIIVDHLRNVVQATRVLEDISAGNFEGLISTITVLELMASPAMTDKHGEAVRSLLGIFDIVAVNSEIAGVGGRYVAKYRASHGLQPMDAIIAATASVNGAALFTLNQKHFRFIEGLVVVNPYLD